MSIDRKILARIMSLGIVGFVMRATNALVQAAANSALQTWGGELYVGVMTAVNSVREILSLPVAGATDGAQPVLSYNFGAGKPERVRQGILFTTITCVIYTALMWISVIVFPASFMRVFTTDPATVEAGRSAIRIYFFGFVFQAFQVCGQTVFLSLGDARHAVFFSLLRKAVIVAPLTILLPRAGLGVNGVFMAEPISNLIGGLACYSTMVITTRKKLALTTGKQRTAER